MPSSSEYYSSDSDNDETEKQRELNMIIFGESGVGKSALINQIFDKNVVEASNRAVGCTIISAKVSGTLKEHPHLKFNVYDTAGLSESDDGSVPTAHAFVQLVKLAYSIPNGINLLICCAEKGRLAGERFKANYRIFIEELCEKRMPCLLVVTKCDNDHPLNTWWNDNEDIVRKQLKFEFIDCVCVSTLKTNRRRPDKILEDYTESRGNLIEAISKCSLSEPMPMDSWKRIALSYARSLYNRIRRLLGLEENSLRPELERMFIELGYSPESARNEANKLLNDLRETNLMIPYEVVDVN
ncbi:unnamed protein product [Rotaria magnacalcarata]|uniref:G domain-containing protein n=1 Tax=Rotaria magnacalcarata TaxID=392030 RepID=A0A816LYD1_9BILA|nr:unnamed protein product [Rotaria magnacalcarata]CAF1650603.1 unnamed protein product [Rotaria magnacalcarata]CAF1966885.1 unnamed protein product [Rotaria magnacalcarata]CAF4158327.1 unnamed protein product [Rotaria magnacalcarata]CAF4230026.1 unnamed protein product [Rotaria magnacalcarata]